MRVDAAPVRRTMDVCLSLYDCGLPLYSGVPCYGLKCSGC
jgi:hypothetical protein